MLQLIQQARGQILLHHQPQLGIGFARGGYEPGQQVRPERRDNAELQRADQRPLAAACRGNDGISLGQCAPRAGDHFLPRRRQMNNLVGALKQSRAKIALQLLELGAERGLADIARGGGAAEMQVIGDGDEVAQIAEVHGLAGTIEGGN